MYDYELYLIDVANFRDTLEPVIEDIIIYDYIDGSGNKIIYESKSKLEINKEK